MRYLILFALSTFILQMTYAQDHILLPVNEISKDPSLEKFVNDLRQVIEREDKSALISMLDQDVSGSLGGDGGVKDFIEAWKLDQDSTVMWSYMSRVIEMGGAYTHDASDETEKYQFVFPYTYNLDLDLDDDYYYLGVITGKNVNLRKDPDTKSNVNTQLTYDVIWFRTDKSGAPLTSGKNNFGDPEWYQIETYNKSHKGWVNWKYVYSLMGPRLFLFKNQTGQWKISAFVMGD